MLWIIRETGMRYHWHRGRLDLLANLSFHRSHTSFLLFLRPLEIENNQYENAESLFFCSYCHLGGGSSRVHLMNTATICIILHLLSWGEEPGSFISYNLKHVL
jgi:hypothetical protein